MTSKSLSVSALGPVQIVNVPDNADAWHYLDSLELLLYLLCNTTWSQTKSSRSTDLYGKTKEQIGQALWTDASPAQLTSNLKARLFDIRRSLGGRDWILFENEQYKFNYSLPCSFDVNDFTAQLAQAERVLRAGDHAQAIEQLRRALILYRGDFMNDYRKRRTAQRESAGDDIEWYMQKRYELQAMQHGALEKLGELLMEQQQYEQAAAVYRNLVSLDEYDDGAHRLLLTALALEGKRSQALQHYRELIARRSDTPPEPELAALAEQIKRGEIQRGAPHPPSFPAAPQAQPTPFQAPAELRDFIGRASNLDTLRGAFQTIGGNHLLCIVGMGGLGKTSLAIHAAHALREQFPDGVLWGNLTASESLAIMDSWARAYGCDYSALPDLASRAAALRSLLADKKVLIVLDDAPDASRARPLILGEQTTLLTTRDSDLAVALGAQIIELPLFAPTESTDLLTRVLGAPRVAAEPAAASEIAALLGHLPLALDITARRLASRPRWTLREMADRLRNQLKRLDELQLGDRAVRASFTISWEALTPALRAAFVAVGAFNGRSFAAPAFAAVAQLDDPTGSEQLDALCAVSLLSPDAATRFRQHPLLADFAREQSDEIRRAETRLLNFYLSFASQHRDRYLDLEDEWDNLTAGIEIAQQQELWQRVIDYGDLLTEAWFARGRFSDARRAYPVILHAARELEEQDPYIAGALNWGKACIDQGDYAEAEEHLQHGLQTSREVNDEFGIGTGLFLLARLAVERSEYDRAQVYLVESQKIRERLNDRAGLAETLYMQARIKYLFFDYTGADEVGREALSVFKSLPPSRAYIVTLRWLAIIASYLNDFDRAINYNRHALELSEQVFDLSEKAATLYSMATVYWRQGDFVNARTYASESLPFFRRIGDRKGDEYVFEQLSKIYAKLENYEQALEYGNKSLQVSFELNDTLGKIRQLQHLGDVHNQLGHYERACKMWLEALPLAQALQHHSLATSLQERIAQLGC